MPKLPRLPKSGSAAAAFTASAAVIVSAFAGAAVAGSAAVVRNKQMRNARTRIESNSVLSFPSGPKNAMTEHLTQALRGSGFGLVEAESGLVRSKRRARRGR